MLFTIHYQANTTITKNYIKNDEFLNSVLELSY